MCDVLESQNILNSIHCDSDLIVRIPLYIRLHDTTLALGDTFHSNNIVPHNLIIMLGNSFIHVDHKMSL